MIWGIVFKELMEEFGVDLRIVPAEIRDDFLDKLRRVFLRGLLPIYLRGLIDEMRGDVYEGTTPAELEAWFKKKGVDLDRPVPPGMQDILDDIRSR